MKTLQQRFTLIEVRDVDKTVKNNKIKTAIANCLSIKGSFDIDVRLSTQSYRRNRVTYNVTLANDAAVKLSKMD